MIRGEQNAQADGVSMFAFDDQDLAGYISSVTNTEDGHIVGERAAVALSSGGTIDNAGLLTGDTMGVLIQHGVSTRPVSGSIIHTGTNTGTPAAGIGRCGL